MARRGNITVKIDGEYNDKDINRAIRDLNALKTQAGATAGPMAGLGKSMIAAGAGAFAMGAIVSNAVEFLKDAAAAAVEDQKSVVALSKALDNLGLAHSQPAIEAFIGQLQLATGVADTDLRPAYQKLVTATGDVAKAQDLLTLSMDISAATGKDLASVSQAMGRASLGQVSALTRLGVPLDANIIKTKDFAAAQQVLTEKFGGQAAAAAETYEGKMRRLSVAVDEAKETIGYALVGALDEAAAAMGGPDGFIPVITLGGQMVADMVTGVGELVVKMAELAAAGKDAAGSGDGGMAGFMSSIAQAAVTVGSFLPGVGQVVTVAYAAGAQLMGMGQEARESAEQLDALAESANGGDVALGKAAIGLGRVATAAHDAAVDMELLKDEVKAYLGVISLSQSQDDFRKKLADLSETLEGNKTSFRGMSDAAKENRDVLRGALGEAAQLVQQMVDQGKISASDAEATFTSMRQSIIDAFVNQGFKPEHIRAFLGNQGMWTSPFVSTISTAGQAAAAAGAESGWDAGRSFSRGVAAGIESMSAAVQAEASRLTALANSYRPSSSGIPGRANGGPVAGGAPYIVGERGPELFVPSTSGSIVPNHRAATGARSTVINITVNAPVGGDLRRAGQDIAEALAAYERGSGPIYVKAS